MNKIKPSLRSNCLSEEITKLAFLALVSEAQNVSLVFVKRRVFIYGLETIVSALFSNTRTRLLYNEREIFNTARSEAECSIENFEFIV